MSRSFLTKLKTLSGWMVGSREDPYRFRRDGHKVFVEWLRPLELWSDKAHANYAAELRSQVRASLDGDEPTWTLVSRENPSAHQDYQRYVQEVREKLIEEYSLQNISEHVGIGKYHMGLLVLSWPVQEGVAGTYPCYFRGVQLKPYKQGNRS